MKAIMVCGPNGRRMVDERDVPRFLAHGWEVLDNATEAESKSEPEPEPEPDELDEE